MSGIAEGGVVYAGRSFGFCSQSYGMSRGTAVAGVSANHRL